MNDSAIKNYATWARRELIAEVAKKCAQYDIAEGADISLDAVNGRVLTAQEKQQRADLLRAMKTDGYEQLIEKAAYTWFNRLLAIRFMEVNDRLSSHIRMLSAADGSFAPQVLREAMDLPLNTLDPAKVAELVQTGDDEALFHLIFLAQCDELADCMPAVFDHVGSAMELLLPDGLLRQGGVVEQLVTAIPEQDWTEGVEIVGWMYQYYVSERKDEVFASFKKGKKAERDAIAPATQLFTPAWIVRYLTENSLGRLWMLNNPDSTLREQMPYYVDPSLGLEEGEEPQIGEFRHISSPEEITVVDPACGSGHILVYAFDLLAAMYTEAGYSNRDAVRLILEKNISGLEIDPRAAAMASFALTMKACELDSRFLRRGVSPRITVLGRIEFSEEELGLCPNLAANSKLLDAVAHLDECGSLLQVNSSDLDAIARDLASLAEGGSLFAGAASQKLQRLQAELKPLAERYDVVVANPPYMGSSSFDKWTARWVKDNYPEAYRDLCTSFIDRGFALSRDDGYSAMVTMQSWMFLGSYEKLRGKILDRHAISSMAHLGTRAFSAIGGEVVSTTATVFSNMKTDTPGTYLRLVDMGSEAEKQAGILEALANPKCGWFYRASNDKYSNIPGNPIAYWSSKALLQAFRSGQKLSLLVEMPYGFKTGDNDRFLRLWWECSLKKCMWLATSKENATQSDAKWFPYNKGGAFRKWYGNNDYLLNYYNGGEEVIKLARQEGRNAADYDNTLLFCPSVTWSRISSGKLHMRYSPGGAICDMTGSGYYGSAHTLSYLQALCNSSIVSMIANILSPTLDYQPGQIGNYPVLGFNEKITNVEPLVTELRSISKDDWDKFESSCDFRRHPLL